MLDIAYRELVDALRQEARAAEPGSRFATVRAIAERFDVSLFAAQQAVRALRDEGLIASHVGRGTFVVGPDGDASAPRASSASLRVLILCHATASRRGDEIADMLRSELQRDGHRPVLVNYGSAEDLEPLLGRGRFDFCILQPRRSLLPVEVLALLKASARHLIIEGRTLELTDVDIVVRNRSVGLFKALNHLRALGHERIGLITEPGSSAAGYAEIENLFRFQAACFSPRDPAVGSNGAFIVEMAHPDEDDTIGSGSIAAMLKEALATAGTPPTAFVVSGRFPPTMLVDAFAQIGLPVPSAVSLVHLRSTLRPGEPPHLLTTVGRRADQVVQSLRNLVDWRRLNPEAPPRLVLDEPELVEGQSAVRIG